MEELSEEQAETLWERLIELVVELENGLLAATLVKPDSFLSEFFPFRVGFSGDTYARPNRLSSRSNHRLHRHPEFHRTTLCVTGPRNQRSRALSELAKCLSFCSVP